MLNLPRVHTRDIRVIYLFIIFTFYLDWTIKQYDSVYNKE